MRRAGRFDLDLLAALHARCFGPAGDEVWDRAALAQLLLAPGSIAYLCADDDDRGDPGPAGFVLARAAGGEAEILSIGVLPEARRRGHGASLIEAVAGEAAGLGTNSVFLEVAADNHAALALYRAARFRQVGRRRGYYRRPTGPVDAILLRRDLM